MIFSQIHLCLCNASKKACDVYEIFMRERDMHVDDLLNFIDYVDFA